MIELSVRLKILMDVLEKKGEALTQILNICENQCLLFSQPSSSERSEFLKQMNIEKQHLIEQVIDCDDVFQSMFDDMRDQFEREAENHLELVRKLQEQIRIITELDVKIRAQEGKNKAILKAIEPPRTTSKRTLSKSYVLKQYEKNKKPEKDN